MSKRFDAQIKYIDQELKKVTSDKATVFKAYINSEKEMVAEKTFIANGPRYRELVSNVDPLNKSSDYILSNILKFRRFAWTFYFFMYKSGLLGHEFRFLKGVPFYSTVQEILDSNKTAANILCCSVGDTESRYVVETDNRQIIEMVESYFDSKYTMNTSCDFPYYITSFLAENSITSFNGFSDDLIEKCILNAPTTDVACGCRAFIIYCLLNSENGKAKLYSVSVLCRQNFVAELTKGFRPVLYNKFDAVPSVDKWLLIPNGDEKRSTQMTAETITAIDFSIVTNKQMKDLLKKWFWAHSSSIATKSKDVPKIIYFINMFFTENEYVIRIDQNLCASYKSHVLSKWNVTETRNSRIYPILEFVRYLDNYSDIQIDKSCYLYLTNRGSLNKKGAVGVKKEELEQIAAYINDHKNDDHNHLCFYVMFHIALNTEFRISQIVSLSSDCVKESMKTGEYIIQSNMKQSGYEEVDQPCARVVREIITSYQAATSEYREQLQPPLRQYLFVREDGNSKVKRPFNRSNFSDFLGNVCKELGLPRYTAKNLRITYITNAKEYAMKNGISDLTLLKITNHANIDTVNNHYIQEKMIDALQATIGVVIGDVNVDGTISASKDGYDTSKGSSVANGCGFCQSAECTSLGPSPCQRCKHFFTTLENIPYYRKEISRLKELNDGTKSPHDAEDLIKLIRLNTYILGKLIELKGAVADGTVC